MFLVLVDSNGKRVDERCWDLAEAKAALAALEEWPRHIQLVHLAVITVRSNANESFVSTNK